MLSKLCIRNYRTFKTLDIDKLGKVNLFSGRNNSGKTSLLETIFLLSGAPNPTMVLNPNIHRGIKTMSGSKIIIQNNLWKPIFHNLDMNSPIEITGHHLSSGKLAIKLTIEQPEQLKLSLDKSKLLFGDELQNREILVLYYTQNDELKAKFNFKMTDDAMKIDKGQYEIDVPFPASILSPNNRTQEEDAQHLGQLRQKKRGDLVLKALHIIEPRLQSIEVNSATGTPMIWGDIGLDELVPLYIMGDGMIQLVRIILTISSAQNGIVLIDEIESGLHHSVLPQTWQVIWETANIFNVQIFASTHSYECIEAASMVFETSNDDEFLFHRLDTDETGCRCVTYNKETMTAAMQHNLEVR